MRKIINHQKNRKSLLTIAAAAAIVILVVSVGIIGAAPFSVQQQGTERAPGPRITSGNIVDGEVRNQDLADDAVTSDKIGDGEVTSADVAEGTITTTDLAEGTIPPPTSGVPNVHIVRGDEVLLFNTIGSRPPVEAVANCPDGEVLTGGGYRGETSLIHIFRNFPSDENTWTVTATRDEGVPSIVGLHAYAICTGPSPP